MKVERHGYTWVTAQRGPRRPAEILAIVEQTGLLDIEWYHRGPVTARGETMQRLYVLARKP